MDIIVTIGPTLETFEHISKAVSKGVNTFRLSLGYRWRDTFSLIKTIREVEGEVKKKLFVLLDLPSSRPRISNKVQIDIKEGDILIVQERVEDGDRNKISINNFDDTFKNIKVGDLVTFLDARLKFTVVSLENRAITLRCTSGEGTLKESNSLTVVNRTNPYELLVDEDIEFFIKLNNNNIVIDWVAFSFAENSEQIAEAKNRLKNYYSVSTPKFIAKIETKRALYQLNDIASEVDGIMVARGDLAVNLGFKPMVAEAQERIIKVCHENNLYSIVATELLEHFVDNGILSRPEIIDLSFSISQRPSALQLGRETVFSDRPFEAIDVLKEFIEYETFRQELYKVSLPKRITRRNKNLIVAIEGANGAGKSTLCKKLSDYFSSKGERDISIKFGVPDIFLEKRLKEKMIADAHWYSSSLFFISGVIEQMRESRNSKDKIVILDRSIWSTLAVQASTDPKRLKFLVDAAFKLEDIEVEPDITIVLRASYETCRERISKKSTDEQKLDELVNSKDFYRKEDQFYDWLTFQRDNIINIDVNNITEEELLEKVVEIIDKKFKEVVHEPILKMMNGE